MHYPATFTADLHYFRGLAHPALARVNAIRQALRALAYPIGHWQTLRKLDPSVDILHLQWSRIPLLDSWLIRQAQKNQIPVVFTVHDADPLFLQGQFSGDLVTVLQLADALIVHTEDSRERLCAAYPQLDRAKMHVIPHIALPDAYLPEHATQEQARQHLNISVRADERVFLFFGSVKHYKGLDVLAEAFERVERPCQLWVIGKPQSASDQQLLDQLAQQPRVTVRPEFVPSAQMWHYFLAADVLVFPYRRIFQSGALIKALNYGRPVIVTDTGGLPESVERNGWVVPPEAPDALAEVLSAALAASDADLQTMGVASIALRDRTYDTAIIAQAHLSLYQQVIKQRTQA